jgi:hypothetical protein
LFEEGVIKRALRKWELCFHHGRWIEVNTPAAPKSVSDRPQGIDEVHINAVSWHKHASPASILIIGALLVAALLGAFGGQPHPIRKITTPAAAIELQLPEILRNGEFFEMRIMITARRSFADLRLSVDSGYWRDLTINTMVPAPSQETSEKDQYIFSYGPVKSGQKLTLKFDGQINPPMFAGTNGHLKLMDGAQTVSVIPVELRVLP